MVCPCECYSIIMLWCKECYQLRSYSTYCWVHAGLVRCELANQKFDNLLALIYQNPVYSNEMFKGGVTKIDVERIREEAKVHAREKKTKKPYLAKKKKKTKKPIKPSSKCWCVLYYPNGSRQAKAFAVMGVSINEFRWTKIIFNEKISLAKSQ